MSVSNEEKDGTAMQCEFLPCAVRLENFVAGVRGSCDRLDIGRPTDKVRLWRGVF